MSRGKEGPEMRHFCDDHGAQEDEAHGEDFADRHQDASLDDFVCREQLAEVLEVPCDVRITLGNAEEPHDRLPGAARRALGQEYLQLFARQRDGGITHGTLTK